MAGKTEKKGALHWAVIAAAIVVVLLLGFAAFNSLTPREQVLRANYQLAEAQSASSDAPTAVDLTVYQAQPSYSYYGYYRNYFNPSSGIALIKEKRTISLPAGLTELALKKTSSHIDGTSLAFKDLTDANTAVLEQNYDYDLVSPQALLDKHVGETVTVTAANATYTGTLLSAQGGLVLQTANGVISLNSYDAINFPSTKNLLTTPTITWLLDSKQAGNHDIEVSYLSSGLAWEANYVAQIAADESTLDLKSWVTIRNDAGDFKDARLKLVAGQVNYQTANQPVPMPMYARGVAEAAPVKSASQFTQQQFSEFHLYSLQRPVTLQNGETKQITFIGANGIHAQKELVYPGSGESVQLKVSFNNSKDNQLGEALPSGKVRVYTTDADGQLQFAGEDTITATPDGQTVRLFLGNSFDVTAKKEQTDYKQIGNCVNQQSESVTLNNAKDSAQTVKVLDNFGADYQILEESQPHELDAGQPVWSVSVPAQASAILTYRVQQKWC